MIPGGFLFLLLLCLSTLNGSNAYCERDDSLIEDGRECRKTCESGTDCKGVKKCYCDGACGMTCFNKLAECEEPGIPNMGTVRRSRLTWGGRAYYTCNVGFAMIGEKMAICNADKQWSPAVPTCEAGCTRPDDVPNSFPSVGQNAFIAGVVYEFLCSTGYYMKGNSNRKCIQSSHEWSESEFSCHLSECGLVDPVGRGTVQYTKEQKFGSIATLECDAGYDVDEKGRTTRCFSGREGSRYGEWVGKLSTCSIITCPDPVTPIHGSIRDDSFIELEYNSRIAYECESSYKLRGSEIAICKESGQWDEAPECVEDPDCNFDSSATPTCLYNNVLKAWKRQSILGWNGFQGYAVKSTRRNSVLRSREIPLEWADDFICLHFYYKIQTAGRKGMLTIKRGYDEIMDWESHKNEKINKWLDSMIQFNSTDDLFFYFTAAQAGVFLDDVTLKAEKCENHCQDQPCRHAGSCINRADEYTCFCTEEYAGKNCQIDRRCSELPSRILNGFKNWEDSKPLIPQKRAIFSCDDGFKLTNSKGIVTSITITCDDDSSNGGGQWDTDPRSIACEEKTCDHPEVKSNQEIDKSNARWLMGDTVVYQCISGFEVRADRTTTDTRTCRFNEQWSGTAPDCIRTFCTYTSSSAMKVIDPQPRYNVGFAIKLKCEHGYRMIGDDILRCVRKNEWSHSPRCIKNECGRLPRIPNANIPHSSYVAYKETYTYTCNSGYYNVRDLTVTCKYDGEFTTMPQCKRIGECRYILDGPDNGHVDGNNKKVTFSCKRMYRLIGSKTSFCDSETSRWTHPAPRCEELQPELMTTFEGIQYLVYMKKSLETNYEDSKGLCNSIGGNLVIFYNDLVRREFESILKIIHGTKYQIWIALRHRKHTNHLQYYWDDEDRQTRFPNNETSGNHRHWDEGYPAALWKGHCVAIDCSTTFYKYGWKNKNCHDNKPFICQRNTITCKRNPCKNNGICNGEDEQPTCGCMPKFSDSMCQNGENKCNTINLQGSVIVNDKGKHSVGTEIILDCEDDKKLVGERIIKCKENGIWSDTETRCEEVVCNTLPTIPQHGYIVSQKRSYPAGEHFPLACDRGYKMTGDSALHCNWNGEWAQTSTSCRRGICRDLSLPENVKILRGQSPYAYGSSIKLGCIKGSQRGKGVLECQDNGQWAPKLTISCIVSSEIKPTTTRSTTVMFTTKTPRPDEGEPCGAPSLPDFAFIDEESSSYPSGTKITLKCVTGQEIVGSSKWQCVDEEWRIPSTTSCKVNICILDAFLLNAGVKVLGFTSSQLYKKKFAVDEEATLICEDSTQNVQNLDDANSGSTIQCRLGGKWSTDSSSYTCGEE